MPRTGSPPRSKPTPKPTPKPAHTPSQSLPQESKTFSEILSGAFHACTGGRCRQIYCTFCGNYVYRSDLTRHLFSEHGFGPGYLRARNHLLAQHAASGRSKADGGTRRRIKSNKKQRKTIRKH